MKRTLPSLAIQLSSSFIPSPPPPSTSVPFKLTYPTPPFISPCLSSFALLLPGTAALLCSCFFYSPSSLVLLSPALLFTLLSLVFPPKFLFGPKLITPRFGMHFLFSFLCSDVSRGKGRERESFRLLCERRAGVETKAPCSYILRNFLISGQFPS